jgi:putative ABC transport system permease protein
MKFILQMALREIRASWRSLIFFFICIGVGVGSIVALRSIIQNVNYAVAGEARSILTADVQVESTRPWDEETLAAINRISESTLVNGRTETLEASTMIRTVDSTNDGTIMVELKGIEPPYPLWGEFTVNNGIEFDHSLLQNNGAVVAQLVLERLNLKVGSRVKLGTSTFEIRAVMDKEPGLSSGFRLGPRVFVERGAIEQAGLVGFGSRARRKILFRTPEGMMPALVKRLRSDIKNSLVSIRSYKESQESINEQYSRAENYLSLTGLVILVLGGIGISSVTRVFIEQRKQSIAVLKCIGATDRHITVGYLMQVLFLGLMGSLLGIVLAKSILTLIGRYYAESLPSNTSYNLSLDAIGQGIALGLLISLLFSAIPLLRIRHIRPNILLHGTDQLIKSKVSISSWITVGVVTVGLVLLSAWQAGSMRIGLYFLGGLLLTALVLQLAAVLLIKLVSKARQIRSFALRQAISSLHRPGNQTRVTIMAVGLGLFLIVTIQSLQIILKAEIDLDRRASIPNMFLIDIQQDQEEGVSRLIEQELGEKPKLVPTLRARILSIDGKGMELDRGEMRRERGRLGREYIVTYRSHLEENETLTEGSFWDSSPSNGPEVSVEEDMRGLAGLRLGSTISFDILGRKIDAKVTSFREVDWRNSRTGFMVLFRPGPLDNAPKTFIGPINGPTEEKQRAHFQRVLLDKYPNISIIDVAQIVTSIRKILDNVTLAVSFIAAFVLFSGTLILIGSISMTKFQRIYEAAVLKTLGATRGVLTTIILIEYGLLGLVAGVIGSITSIGLTFAITKYLLNIPWSFTPSINIVAILINIVLVIFVGVLSSFEVLNRRPLSILRSQ